METATQTLLGDLLDTAELAEAIEQGYVRRQVHPDPSLCLEILNYTERCQYERAWNDVTRQCRGLIVRGGTEVIARPFPKFFNYGEHPEGSLDMSAPTCVFDDRDQVVEMWRSIGLTCMQVAPGSF